VHVIAGTALLLYRPALRGGSPCLSRAQAQNCESLDEKRIVEGFINFEALATTG
jgi:hypothetical protein